MRDGRLAEHLLGLVSAPTSAASTVGDLLEDVPRTGWGLFGISVARVAGATVVQQILRRPIPLLVEATVAWFVYMTVALALVLLGALMIDAAWAIAYVILHHGIGALRADASGIVLDHWRAPSETRHVLQPWLLLLAAPFLVGRMAAHHCRERTLAFLAVLATMWMLWMTVIPFVGFERFRVGVTLLPVIVPAMLAGAIWQRVGGANSNTAVPSATPR